MISRHMQFALALAVCSCVLLASCGKEEGGAAATGMRGGVVDKGKMISTPHTITLSADGGGNCLQSLDGGTAAAAGVEMPWGDTVTFDAGKDGNGNKIPFTLTFPPAAAASCDSPFEKFGCQSNFAAAAITVSQAGGVNYPYLSITINGKACGSPGSLGLIMKP